MSIVIHTRTLTMETYLDDEDKSSFQLVDCALQPYVDYQSL